MEAASAVMNTINHGRMRKYRTAATRRMSVWEMEAFRRPSMLFAAAVIGSNEVKRGQPSASLHNLHASAFRQNAELQVKYTKCQLAIGRNVEFNGHIRQVNLLLIHSNFFLLTSILMWLIKK